MKKSESSSRPNKATKPPSRRPPAKRAAAVLGNAVRKTAREIETHETGIALALLRDFYWIELGIRSYLRSRENPEFSRAEGLVIANLMLGYSRPSDIARQLGVSRQAIHVTIQQMKQKGIVDLVQDPDDKRINQVVVTDVAKKMNDDGIVAMRILWRELGKRLGKAKVARAAAVLGANWGPPVLFDTAEGGPEWWRS